MDVMSSPSDGVATCVAREAQQQLGDAHHGSPPNARKWEVQDDASQTGSLPTPAARSNAGEPGVQPITSRPRTITGAVNVRLLRVR